MQEAGRAPGPVWTGAENMFFTGILSPDRPARSQSLYRLRYPPINRNVLAHYARRADGTPIKNMATVQIFDVILQNFTVSGHCTEEQFFFDKNRISNNDNGNREFLAL
jgi:hypothetical protein